MSAIAREPVFDATPSDIAAAIRLGEWNPRVIEDDAYDRRLYLGSSNAAAILGVAPEIKGERATPLSVWKAKMGDDPEEMDPETKLFLARRKRWEPVVVEMLREEFDAEVVSVNRRYVDPYLPFLVAEIDFEWRDPEDGSIQNGEIKTVSPFAFKEKYGWGEPGTDEFPINYFAQVMHGMMVKGTRKTVVAAMVGLDQMVFYFAERNEKTIADMRRTYLRFWNENVVKGVAPDPLSMGDLRAIFRTSVPGLSVEATSEIGSKALRLRALKAQIEALEAEGESLEFDVKLAMKNAERLTIDGRDVFSWKESAYSTFDVVSLRTSKEKAERAVYLKYLKSKTHRVFRRMSFT